MKERGVMVFLMIGVVFVFCGRGINCAGLCLFWTGDFSVVFSPLC